MSWFRTQSFGAHVALAVVAGFVLGVSAEVLADTVYTWTTDDGTVAYTDEDKRVPARYRNRMEVQVVDGLDGYNRFTPVEGGAPVVDGAIAREADGPAASASAPIPAPPRPGVAVISGGSRYGNGGVVVPTDSGASDEPMVIEQRRVKRNSMATSHETVIRQGDRVVMIRRDEPSHREGTSMVPPTDD